MFYSEIYQPGVADFDPNGKFGYETILRIFENTASRHSDSTGDDVIESSRHGITWVLTDWRVQIVRRPDSKAPLRVTTWVRDSVPTGRIFRDYTLADETGTELVRAESRLVLFDLRAQKIIRIDQPRFQSYRPEARGVFASAAPRLRAPAAFDGEKTLPLRRSDMDFNGHVHNTKYLDFALEALPDTVPRDAFTGFRMVYPKAVKDVEAVTLKYTLTDTGPFVCVYSADTLCTLIRFET
ncbi:MAG: acyl-[acyl-carrier-protein] thioesterase [Oscillospiraceae bacterium]|jgi:medium-chain acyl-[acyl-carrier-protein] hydrolase